MGDSISSTPQANGSQLAKTMASPVPPVDPNDRGGTFAAPPQLSQLFAQNKGYGQPNQVGYQQPNQVPTITQPHLQTPILPTPQQAAAVTQQQMLARTPPPPIVPQTPTGPKKPVFYHGGGSNR